MRRSCRYCGGVHDVREVCPNAPPKWGQRRKDTRASGFRSTNAWTQKAIRIKQRDKYLCRACMAEGVITTKGLETHHIVPIEKAYDRRLDDDNLITLCVRHHKMAENGEISAEELRGMIASEGE